MLGAGAIAKRFFGSANDRKIHALKPRLQAINAAEPAMKALSDAELQMKTARFRERIAAGESLDSLLVDAFACVREVAQRMLAMRPFDVQCLGGIVLHQGNIAEMKTGEGKTLAATMPIYLNALSGRGVHLVTVNDYLATRDAEWMGQIYRFLGLSVGVIVPGMDDSARRQAYAADVTYSTNNELGFDYLRDNMKYARADMVQRRNFAIVDEVDSILIDEARTPLIISGPTEDMTELYRTIDTIAGKLARTHYELDEKARAVSLTEEGNEFFEAALHEAGLLKEEESFYDPQSVSLVHHVNQALRAHTLFRRDRDYILRKGRVVIIDEFTGRMMEGRRYGDGLHQAIEAKENQPVQPENTTLASVTFQNYFRLYDKLAGMTGTALTEADELMEIYRLDVLAIPTNLPVMRVDDDDMVFRTAGEKTSAILDAIREGHERRQPILVGTTSIEKSEMLSERLKALGVPHSVLNARFHEQEAQIIAEAGVPAAVTIATNMAGRGTDIQLGGNVEMRLAERCSGEEDEATLAAMRKAIGHEVEEARTRALAAGGLWVIGTERHESRRIDNQLRGRSGRQGDPGRSTFFLSLEDDLMRIFGSDRMDGMLRKLGIEEGEAIIHPWVNKAIARAQGKVEAHHFDIRKNVIKYDDVMNDQRKVIFEQRLEIMEADSLTDTARDMRHALVEDLLGHYLPPRTVHEPEAAEGLEAAFSAHFGTDVPVAEWFAAEGTDREDLLTRLLQESDRIAAMKMEEIGADLMRDVERMTILRMIDVRWHEHLATLDHLRSVIGLRGYAQRDPLNEYKSEAFTLFESMLSRLRGDVTRQLMHVRLREDAPPPPPDMPKISHPSREAPLRESGASGGGLSGANAPAPLAPARHGARIGRNAPCPCGSGKKYKHCHGRPR